MGNSEKDGKTPYIIHPLSMACYAVALGIKEDSVIATILLHDICEDCNVSLQSLPFSHDVREGVKCMTFKMNDDENKIQAKQKYFSGLLNSREALVCKGLDRYDNLSDMVGEFDANRIAKNLVETDLLLLPVLKEGKEKWPDLSNIIFVIRNNIKNLVAALKFYNQTEYDKWYGIYQTER